MPAKSKPSPAKAAAARANGAKSRGPKTTAGKKKSSRNSLKHGARCSSRTPLLLPGEDPTKLQLYTNSFYEYFRPKDLAEAAIVDTMIAQVWKTARITGYESEILTSAAEDLHQKLAEEYESITAARLFALAFQDSAEKGKNPLPLRYLVSSRNMFRSALSDLIRMRLSKGDPARTTEIQTGRGDRRGALSSTFGEGSSKSVCQIVARIRAERALSSASLLAPIQ